MHCEGQALALRWKKRSCYRRAGACPPPCTGLSKPREGQALALRWQWRFSSRPMPREGQALALRWKKRSCYRRAGACPPPCRARRCCRSLILKILKNLVNPASDLDLREGNPLGCAYGIRGPSRYGERAVFVSTDASRGSVGQDRLILTRL